jgi:uncharacterized membrane protein YhaH (DUF805 family)
MPESPEHFGIKVACKYTTQLGGTMTINDNELPPAGWYVSPHDPQLERWFDGKIFTDLSRGKTAENLPSAQVTPQFVSISSGASEALLESLPTTFTYSSFTAAIASSFRNYASFRGRATRSEYWFWWLFTFLASSATLLLILVFSAAIGIDFASLILLHFTVLAGLLVPSIAVQIRRFHDIGKSGAYFWFLLIPFGAGQIIVFIFSLQPSEPLANLFGNAPTAFKKIPETVLVAQVSGTTE